MDDHLGAMILTAVNMFPSYSVQIKKQN